MTRGKEIEQLGASRERRLPTGAQVFDLPHKKIRRRLRRKQDVVILRAKKSES
jgi:hypothetical protein